MIWLLPWKAEGGARQRPWITWSLLATNVAVFVWLFFFHHGEYQQIVETWGLVPGDWHWYEFLTGNFLHGGLMHLFVNMVFLWIFGDSVEDAFGPLAFLVLYFGGGFLGDLLFVYANDFMLPTIGASGCLAAVAGAYVVLFFQRRVELKLVVVVFPVYTLTLPAVLLVLLFFGMDVFQTFQDKGAMPDEGGTNFVAHGIGVMSGIAVGVLATIMGVMRRYDELPIGDRWWGYWPEGLAHDARRARAADLARRRAQQQRGKF